jgi:hypothetical protein
MAKHVRVDRETELGSLSDPGDRLEEAPWRHWAASLGEENVSGIWVLAAKLPQDTDLDARQWVNIVYAALSSPDVQPANVQFDLIPPQGTEFSHTGLAFNVKSVSAIESLLVSMMRVCARPVAGRQIDWYTCSRVCFL